MHRDWDWLQRTFGLSAVLWVSIGFVMAFANPPLSRGLAYFLFYDVCGGIALVSGLSLLARTIIRRRKSKRATRDFKTGH
jgi:hypothetical protein